MKAYTHRLYYNMNFPAQCALGYQPPPQKQHPLFFTNLHLKSTKCPSPSFLGNSSYILAILPKTSHYKFSVTFLFVNLFLIEYFRNSPTHPQQKVGVHTISRKQPSRYFCFRALVHGHHPSYFKIILLTAAVLVIKSTFLG